MTDSHGVPLADYYHCQPDNLLYVRWHGHLTGDTVVETFRQTLYWQRRLAPRQLLLDRSRTTGVWEEALPWIQFEWLPESVALRLEQVHCVLVGNPLDEHCCQEFVGIVERRLPVHLFHSSHQALARLCRPMAQPMA
ncbi:hypothetical protein ACFQ48_01170 [Hymenobacter caeli]|uniref:Uncharacterized protein n=2 Tax=Hymenobacter caeli TaxID=2735894 RepID=A0ABX2FJY9_9BACT|nr:hypothetical protein [Hymenobacter caeli]NRT17431.1 hypothetical protein [Hymenobacter caeli]